jgi:DNA uptake protein ComE-like DNA-binding protein
LPTDADAAAAEQRVRDKVAQVRFEEQRIRAEADRRMQEAERLQSETPIASLNSFGEPPAPEPEEEAPDQAPAGVAESTAADPPVPAVPAADLGFAEQRLQEGREARERSMQEAERRLAEIDQRTKAAEERAATAKRLEGARAEEEAQQRRLEEMQRSVEDAEKRAAEAERRAREAEEAVLRAIGAPPAPAPAAAPTPEPPAPVEPPAASEVPAPFQSPSPAQPDITPPGFQSAPPAPVAAEPINLNSVTFEGLRAQNLTVTQATRLLAHRERLGGFNSVEDLDEVAGFPPELLTDLKSRATV